MNRHGTKMRIDQANTLQEMGRNEEAISLLLELPTSVLEEPMAAYVLGCSLASLGRKEEACKAFERARLETPEAVYWQRCRQIKVMLELGF